MKQAGPDREGPFFLDISKRMLFFGSFFSQSKVNKIPDLPVFLIGFRN
jgi:hypothetical protein